MQRVVILINSFAVATGFSQTRLGSRLYLSSYYYYKRYYESRKLFEILEFLSLDIPNRKITILDVGAHVGSSTKIALDIFSEASVHAFEPDRRNSMYFVNWHDSAIKRGIVSLTQKAVWNSSGEIPFQMEKSNTANNKYDKKSDNFVPCVSLDDYVDSKNLSVNIIKIDVQGFEFEVLQGASKVLLNQNPYLIIEFDESAMKERSQSVSELLTITLNSSYLPWNHSMNTEFDTNDLIEAIKKSKCLDVLFKKVS